MMNPGILLIALTSGLFPLDRLPAPPANAREFLTEAGARIVDSPARVEIFRLDPQAKEEPAGEHVEDWEVIKTIKTPASELVARGRAAVLSDKTYDFTIYGQNKWCGDFEPGVAMKFWRGGTSVTGLICFKCNDLAIVIRDENDERVHAQMADIKPGRAALVTLAKRAFPEDEVIQDLKEEAEKQ